MNDSNLKVLLVEDNPVNQKVTVYQLKSLGYIADVSTSGQEALQQFAGTGYDLVLTNCEMPGMDGYALSAAIRRLELEPTRDRQFPTVIFGLSADSAPSEAAKCLAAGMNGVLNKPVRKEELALTLEQWSQKILRSRSGNATQAPQPDSAIAAKSPNQDGCNPPLDWEHLHQMSDNSYEFELELLSVFVEDTQTHLKTVKGAIAASNFGEIEQAAHHIKGASANVGAKTMQAAAAEIEQQARRQKMEQADHLVTEIEQALNLIEKFVQENN